MNPPAEEIDSISEGCSMTTSSTPEGDVQAFIALRNRVTRFCFEYRACSELFFHSPEREELLNRCAGPLFAIILRSLVDGLLLELAVIGDPPDSRVGETRLTNLSLLYALKLAESRSTPLQSVDLARVKNAVSKFVKDLDPIKRHRHKRIAHADALTALDPAHELPTVVRDQMDHLATDLFAIMNDLAPFFGQTDFAFDQPDYRQGADQVVRLLDRGLTHAAFEREVRGKYLLNVEQADLLRQAVKASFRF